VVRPHAVDHQSIPRQAVSASRAPPRCYQNVTIVLTIQLFSRQHWWVFRTACPDTPVCTAPQVGLPVAATAGGESACALYPPS
jgi:hypothetical protein